MSQEKCDNLLINCAFVGHGTKENLTNPICLSHTGWVESNWLFRLFTIQLLLPSLWMAKKFGFIFTTLSGLCFQHCLVWCSDVHRHIRIESFSWCKAARVWNWPHTAIYCRDYKFQQQYLHSRLHLCRIKHNALYHCLPYLWSSPSLCIHLVLCVDASKLGVCSPGYDGDTLFSVSERCLGTQWGRCESSFWLSLSSVTVSSFSIAQFKGRTNVMSLPFPPEVKNNFIGWVQYILLVLILCFLPFWHGYVLRQVGK
jgi:hypothetical protein